MRLGKAAVPVSRKRKSGNLFANPLLPSRGPPSARRSQAHGRGSHRRSVGRRFWWRAVERGYAPFAPHLLYPQFVDDGLPEEREAGIACGLAFMAVCGEVWAYVGEGVSDGMHREMAHAQRLGKPLTELTEI
jgi:hypothetical protein